METFAASRSTAFGHGWDQGNALRRAQPSRHPRSWTRPGGRSPRCAISGGEGGNSGPATSSYLTMWKAATERKRKEEQQAAELELLLQRQSTDHGAGDDARDVGDREKQEREQRFFQMLQVPEAERRKVEQQQAVDRAAAALAAAQALLVEVESKQRLQRQVERGRTSPSDSSPAGSKKSSLTFTRKPTETPVTSTPTSSGPTSYAPSSVPVAGNGGGSLGGGNASWLGGSSSVSGGSDSKSMGGDFWSWEPPKASATPAATASLPPEFKPSAAAAQKARRSTMVMERPSFLDATLDLPLEADADPKTATSASTQAMADLGSLLKGSSFTLPPLQSTVEIIQPALAEPEVATTAETAKAPAGSPSEGVMPDGSRWWRTTGTNTGAHGEVCEWTVIRGVSADGSVEWEEKWWEKWDAFDYKEMGAEKSGRNSAGGVWRESWQEATWQDKKNGMPHIEKSADKWGQDGRGGEWHEKWWEHYDGMGKAEKWADKWSKIDPGTPLDEGHAHVWHEKWGEEFDGKGAASKYCDKWAERCIDVESNSWTKWGDKWDENFNRDALGFRRGETWWEGSAGERWNRNWSEGHNGSGWVHKQGSSSSGQGWDVHEPMDTWYERKPHFGFKECMQQSHKLRQVGKSKKKSL